MTRFALYFAPEDGTALGEFGWRWLGRRPDTPEMLPLPESGIDRRWQEDLVREARGYGFHGTLKAPFRLAEGMDAGTLRTAAADLARSLRPFVEPPFIVARLNGFFAFRPQAASAAINDLAALCVRTFDRFRAPPTPAERQRRLAGLVDEQHKELFERWGYPYVFDQFRLHLTLTRPVAAEEQDEVHAALTRLAAPALAEPVEFRSLSLFEQPGPGHPFVLTERFPFG